jgi:hypothetical protein
MEIMGVHFAAYSSLIFMPMFYLSIYLPTYLPTYLPSTYIWGDEEKVVREEIETIQRRVAEV